MENFAIPKDAERRFEERGYFVVRQIIDTDAVRAVRDELARIIAEDAPGFALDRSRVDGVALDGADAVRAVGDRNFLSDVLWNRWLTADRVLALQQRFLGDFVVKYGSRLGQDRYDARYDLNGDGEIGFDDFLIFADSFGLSS